MLKIWKNLILTTYILFFMPAFVFFVTKVNYYPFSIVFSTMIILIIFLNKPILMLKKIKNMIYKLPSKYLLLLYCWIIFASLISVFYGYYSFSRFFMATIIGFSFRALLVYILPIVTIPNFVSTKNIIKLFSFIYLVIFIWGILEFFGAKYGITFINLIESFVSRIRSIDESIIIDVHSNMPRIHSFFMEPSSFGQFISINLPILYALSETKNKIFNCTFLNFFTKKFNCILAWLCLYLVQSPIFFIIALLVTFVYYFKGIILCIKKYNVIVLLLFSFITVIVAFNTESLITHANSGFFHRIINVLTNIQSGSFVESIVKSDPSFATRITNLINQLMIFLRHPLTGIGFGNVGEMVVRQFINSPVALPEIQLVEIAEATNHISSFTGNALGILLYQVGLPALLLYCKWALDNILCGKKYFKRLYGIEHDFAQGLTKSLIVIFMLSLIYNQLFMDEFLFLLFGINTAFIFYCSKAFRISSN